MGKLARSWALLKASASILAGERKLLVFPLLAGLFSLLAMASFVLPAAYLSGLFASVEQFEAQVQEHGNSAWYALLFAFYLVQYAVVVFFNTALVSVVLARLDGRPLGVRGGLLAAWSKWPQILGYAAIAATVGVLLRALEERMGIIGRWVIAFVGVAWTVATFLVVPVLAATDVGPVDAVKRSAGLLRRTWGENIAGNLGLGLIFGLFSVLLMLVATATMFLAVRVGGAAAALVVGAACFVAFVVLMLVKAALDGVFATLLYRYAERGEAGPGFAPGLLEDAFRSKQAA